MCTISSIATNSIQQLSSREFCRLTLVICEIALYYRVTTTYRINIIALKTLCYYTDLVWSVPKLLNSISTLTDTINDVSKGKGSVVQVSIESCKIMGNICAILVFLYASQIMPMFINTHINKIKYMKSMCIITVLIYTLFNNITSSEKSILSGVSNIFGGFIHINTLIKPLLDQSLVSLPILYGCKVIANGAMLLRNILK